MTDNSLPYVGPTLPRRDVPHSALWDRVSRETGKPRDVCKKVIYGFLFGADLISLACHERLKIDEIVEIRNAFDEATRTWNRGR